VKTDIEYLRELEGNLMAAARREGAPVAAPVRRRRPSWRRGMSVRLVAAGMAAFLAIAGGIGYFATRGSYADARLTAKAGGRISWNVTAPDTGTQHLSLHDVPGPVASASPAPDESRGRSTLPGISSPAGPIVGPSIVKTAELSVRVAKGSFDRQFAKATEIAGASGGYVATSSVENGRTHSGTITIRVPADRFEGVLNELRNLGHVDRASISGQDVTAKFVDLAARLHNSQDKVVVLRRLLAKAPSVAATLRVSNALSSAELEVEESIDGGEDLGLLLGRALGADDVATVVVVGGAHDHVTVPGHRE